MLRLIAIVIVIEHSPTHNLAVESKLCCAWGAACQRQSQVNSRRTISNLLKRSDHVVLLRGEVGIGRWTVRMEHVVLVTEDVVVDVVLLGRLRRQHKRLHERTHRSIVVRKLTDHLSINHTQ